METYTFTAPDCWTPVPSQPEWAWGEDEDEVAFMRRLGYAFDSEAPNTDIVEFVGGWALYVRPPSELTTPRYVLLVWIGGTTMLVFIQTPPDLLAYLARYGTIGQDQWRQEDFGELKELLEKLFQAWHRHHATMFCRQCSPMEWERWQASKAKRAARNVVQLQQSIQDGSERTTP
jgi:hypothetical protein